jgi:DNA polymerase-3 subunit epsilon
MENSKDDIAKQLVETGEYRLTKKYKKPLGYNLNINIPGKKRIGVFLDIEATGLSHLNNKLIELGMVKFEYSDDGKIFKLLDEFHSYQDPKEPIPSFIVELTGITDEIVRDHNIDENHVLKYLQDVDIIIAHNARFDRAFFESSFPNIPPKAWGCSMSDINWRKEDITSSKLDYIAYRYGFFYEGHRAIADCLAGIHILAQNSFVSNQPLLKILLNNALELEFQLWAKGACYESKDLLKSRGYRWSEHSIGKFKAWNIIVSEARLAEEIEYLRSEIYRNQIDIPIEIHDAYNRYSILNHYTDQSKYSQKLKLAHSLCKT